MTIILRTVAGDVIGEKIVESAAGIAALFAEYPNSVMVEGLNGLEMMIDVRAIL